MNRADRIRHRREMLGEGDPSRTVQMRCGCCQRGIAQLDPTTGVPYCIVGAPSTPSPSPSDTIQSGDGRSMSSGDGEAGDQEVLEEVLSKAISKPYLWKNCHYSESLKDGAFVKVVSYSSLNSVHVIAVKDKEALNAYKKAVTDYAENPNGAINYDHPPVPGEMVLAKKFNADTLEMEGPYRARVNSVFNDSCKVEYVDFGETEDDVNSKELLELNDDLAVEPIYGLPIFLRDAPIGAKCELKVNSYKVYRKNLSSEKLRLKLVPEGESDNVDPQISEVYNPFPALLYTMSNVCVNTCASPIANPRLISKEKKQIKKTEKNANKHKK